jgi:hypothetical protein
MPKGGFAYFCTALLIACTLAGVPSACAQVNDRLQSEHFGSIATGEYQAGDNLHFALVHYDNAPYPNLFLMRFTGQPEVYVLYADYGTLGGQVLRYDSGSIAIQITGWGGLTLYTDQQPEGIPASRVGDAGVPGPAPVSMPQFQSAADDESAHLAYARGVHVGFNADLNALAGDAALRALAFDTMENAARGIDRFTSNPAGHNAVAQRVVAVRFQTGDKPVIRLDGKVLTVTFNPQRGYQGRASSRAIAFALGKLFGVPIPN